MDSEQARAQSNGTAARGLAARVKQVCTQGGVESARLHRSGLCVDAVRVERSVQGVPGHSRRDVVHDGNRSCSGCSGTHWVSFGRQTILRGGHGASLCALGAILERSGSSADAARLAGHATSACAMLGIIMPLVCQKLMPP